MLKDKFKEPHSPANTPVPADKQIEATDNHSALTIRLRLVRELKTLVQSFIEYAKKAEL